MGEKRVKKDRTNFSKKKIDFTENVLIDLKSKKIIKDYFIDDNFCLINAECLTTMNALSDLGVKVDHIITDIPYGTINGLSIEGWKKKKIDNKWDSVLNNMEMYESCFNISKANSNILLFCQEPMTTSLINDIGNFQKFCLSNKMIWVKNNHANGFGAKHTPLNYYEEILLIRKTLDSDNCLELRRYFKKVLEYIGKDRKEIIATLNQGLDHCFRYTHRTFYLPTEKNYQLLIDTYGIDKMKGFINYCELKKQWKFENDIIFNIPAGQKIVKNVLNFKKDKFNIHPTQKPVELLKYLIEIFSNENESILDFTSGSGSTGIAAVLSHRKFIGIELDEQFYKKSVEWYKSIQK